MAAHLGKLTLALIGRVTALVHVLHESLNIDLLFILLLFFNDFLKGGHFLLKLCVFFLLHYKLADEKLSIILLGFEVRLQLGIPLDQKPIFIINALCNGRDKLQIVLHFVFSFLEVALLVALERLLLLDRISHLLHFCVEFANDVFFLLVAQFFHFWNYTVDHPLNMIIG